VDNGVYDIFVLEDSPERIKWFRKTFGDCNLTFTDDVTTACDELRTKDYDLIFLDRDLGHPRGENGEDVAWVMKEEKLAQNTPIVVHTVNPRGQRVIKRYLGEHHTDVHIINFTQLHKMKKSDFGI
jgi:CheY-like chemotaxis protein